MASSSDKKSSNICRGKTEPISKSAAGSASCGSIWYENTESEDEDDESQVPFSTKRSGSCISLGWRSSLNVRKSVTGNAAPHPSTQLSRKSVVVDERLNFRAQKEAALSEETRQMLIRAIKENAFCAKLGQKQIEDIIERMAYFTFAKGDNICTAGEVGHYFLIVGSGDLAVYVNGSQVKSLTTGTAFGEIALLHETPRTATVTAINNCALWGVNRDTFRAVLKDHAQQRAAENLKLLDLISIFEYLPSSLKVHIGELALYEQTPPQGAQVFTEGEAGIAIYIVRSGQLSVVKGGHLDAAGALQETELVRTLSTWDLFGEEDLEKRMNTVITDTEVDLVCIGIAQLKEAFGENLLACLEHSVVLSRFKEVRVLSHLSHAQQSAILQCVAFNTFEPGKNILWEETLQLVVVLNGEATGENGKTTLTLTRGMHCEDEMHVQAEHARTASHAGCASMPMSGCDSVSSMTFDEASSPRSNLHGLVAGPAGCRIATLTKDGLVDAMEKLGLLEIGEGSVDDGIQRMQRVLLANQVPMFRNLTKEQTASFI